MQWNKIKQPLLLFPLKDNILWWERARAAVKQPISLNVEKKALPKVDILAADFICTDTTKLTANVLGIAL